MYNLLEYSKNYRKTTGSLWNYYRDEPSNPLSSNSESFKYKTNITGNTYDVGADEAGYDANKIGKKEMEVVFPLKPLSNFWRTLADMTVRAAGNNNDPPAIVAPTGLEFQITDKKLYAQLLLCQKKITRNF